VVMIGGPVAFMAIAIWGILWLLGPAPPDSPIQRLRDGRVTPGMTAERAVEILGPPKAVVEREDGSRTLIYQRDSTDPGYQDDGLVEIGAGGFVISTRVERVPVEPPAPAADTAPQRR
jgi:hypothetical protein